MTRKLTMRRLIAGLGFVLLAGSAHADTIEQRAVACFACHGEHGQSETENTPSLGGQQPAYALIQLFMFREKLRSFEPMNEMTKSFTDDDLRTFSEFIGKLPKPNPPADTGDPARIERGKRWCRRTIAAPATISISPAATMSRASPTSARIISRRPCGEYKDNNRHGYDGTMAEVLQPVTPEEIADLAYYLARLR